MKWCIEGCRYQISKGLYRYRANPIPGHGEYTVKGPDPLTDCMSSTNYVSTPVEFREARQIQVSWRLCVLESCFPPPPIFASVLMVVMGEMRDMGGRSLAATGSGQGKIQEIWGHLFNLIATGDPHMYQSRWVVVPSVTQCTRVNAGSSL